jgi:protocatechuate 3,4-dioxygenase beta subunit
MMEKLMPTKRTRREFLQALLAMPAAFVLAAFGRRTKATTPMPSATLLPTPDCGDDDDITPRQTEGPFYTPNSPKRTSLLEPGITGTMITVTGQVLTTDCKPVANALVDFWHADDNGEYDNVGYKLRGHQFTDAHGRYTLKTIVPGLYPGRTRHFHVKVQAPNQRILTTQLYFPDEPRNKRDRIFNPVLLMDVKDAPKGEGKTATFNFVLKIT